MPSGAGRVRRWPCQVLRRILHLLSLLNRKACRGLRIAILFVLPLPRQRPLRSRRLRQRDQPKATSKVPPASIEEKAASRQSHLSSDPRVQAARLLVERNRFAEALEILRPLVPDHPDQTDVRFLLGLAASRGSQERPEVDDEQRLALLDEAIAAFRSILIRRPGLVRVRLELALAFYLKEEDQLARGHFDRALVGRPPEALVANVNQFLNVMRARRRWRGYFGFSVAPDTNINAASDAEFIYINGLPFRRGRGPGQFRYRLRGLGRRRIPVSPGRATGACARVSTSTTANIRGTGSTRRTWVSTRGRAG